MGSRLDISVSRRKNRQSLEAESFLKGI